MEQHPEVQETQGEIRAVIALSFIPNLGAVRVKNLIDRFGSAASVFDASVDELARMQGIGRKTAEAICSFCDYKRVDRQIHLAERVQARLVTYRSVQYPELLRTLFDPPPFLWVRGPMSFQSLNAIAIVGTRKPSPYGKRVAADFAMQLVAHGFSVVSGLAYGIDALAHMAAIEAGGRTIAVLGSGVDRIYPSKHYAMAGEIMAEGALISEYPLRAKPDAVNFPRRNRIISGMSRGTIVVEAYEKGGALITARTAVEQNREVFAVPGSIYSSSAAGVHRLIQRGHAKLVQNVEDILEELGIGDEALSRQVSAGESSRTQDLNAVEEKLIHVLTSEPMQIDVICDRAELDISTALVYLLSLEFKGLVFQMAGKHFYKA